jgi:hypothetical protein
MNEVNFRDTLLEYKNNQIIKDWETKCYDLRRDYFWGKYLKADQRDGEVYLYDSHSSNSRDRILNGTLISVSFALSLVFLLLGMAGSFLLLPLALGFVGLNIFLIKNFKDPFIKVFAPMAIKKLTRDMNKTLPPKPEPVTEMSNSPREIFDILKAISGEASGVYNSLSYRIKERVKATNKAIADVEKIVGELECVKDPTIIISSRIAAAKDVVDQLRNQVLKLQSQLEEADSNYAKFESDYKVYSSSLCKDIELEKISSAFELTYDNEAAIKQNEIEIQQFHDMVMGMKARFEALSEITEITEPINAFIKA